MILISINNGFETAGALLWPNTEKWQATELIHIGSEPAIERQRKQPRGIRRSGRLLSSTQTTGARVYSICMALDQYCCLRIRPSRRQNVKQTSLLP